MNDEAYMRLAIAAARSGIEAGQTPFGACIVRDGRVLTSGHNQVWDEHDVSAHAEIQALREAGKKLREINLRGATIYCTCEPCPMCFGAIHWAKIGRIVFGAGIADAASYGFSELNISNQTLKREGGSSVEIVSGFLREESLELFRLWSAREDRRPY